MKKLKLNSNAFNKGEVLTRTQLKKVMGGNGSDIGGSDCVKTCDCGDGKTMEAKVTNCDADTCDTTGTGATCKVNGVTTGQSCATVCQYA